MAKLWLRWKYTQTNSKPTDIALSATSWANSGSVGTTLATISGTDPDVGDTLTYSLPDAPAEYTIVGTALKIASALTEGISLLTIRATDNHGAFFDKQFDIEVTPPPSWTIETAQTYIEDTFATCWGGLEANSSWDSTTTVVNPGAVNTAIVAAIAAGKGTKHKIICDWDGDAGTGVLRTYSGFINATDGWSDNGGGVYIVAAPGKSPRIIDQIDLRGLRGVHFKGIRFAGVYSGSGSNETQYNIQIKYHGSYPAKAVVRFTDCIIGGGGASNTWIRGFRTGVIADDIMFERCTFYGVIGAMVCQVKQLRVHYCDIQQSTQDGISNFGYSTQATGVYANTWLKQTTFRNPADTLGNRYEHLDLIQTGNSVDTHLGYNLLMEDCFASMNHSYSGGGTQGSYNDDKMSLDNLFVIRRCGLAATARLFGYFSPMGTKTSFVDACTFARAGRVPSNFTGDTGTAEDFTIGIVAHGLPSIDLALVVTDTACGTTPSADSRLSISTTYVDYRNTSTVTNASQRPENFFVGTNFERGGASSNSISGKFGYDLPNEAGTQADFIGDWWANFEPKITYSGQFCPDPTGLTWAAPAP